MIRSSKIRRAAELAAVLTAAGMVFLTGCTKVDDRLGAGYQPGDQQMKIGLKVFALAPDAERPYFETRLYKTDSLKASNLGEGYFGVMHDETFGRRTAGFLTQYRAVALSDTTGFGYQPIFDSIELKIKISNYGGDTLKPMTYNVYEVISNDYLNPSLTAPAGAGSVADTLFYPTFDPTPYLNPNPVFTFTFPNGTTTGPATEYVTLQPTPEGRGLIKRLMLLEGKYKGDMTIYRNPELWVDYFNGIYIKPAQENPSGEGNLFATNLAESGLLMYTRSRNRTDPTLIQDTITASYLFYREDDPYGNVSINTIRHDYTGSKINPADIDERNEQRPLNPNVYVEGMDGVITELTLTDALFEGIEALYKEVTDESGMPYTSIAINQAELMIYLEKSDYDWEKIDVGAITPLLDASFERLGLYADYKHVLGISDYYYTYERLYSSQNFQLPYGGYLNRSQGCYVMDITSHLQEVWNGYLKSQGIETGGSQTENPAPRTIYIGPEAYGLFTMPYTSAQGMENTANNAPIKLRLIYTMIK